MSRIFSTQLPVDSIDAVGISAITAADGPAFDPTLLAAAAPVHFHPLGTERWLMVFSTWWSEATPDESVRGTYTDRTTTTDAGWVILSAPTGARTLHGSSVAIPRRVTGSLTLTGATSRSSDYLFLLYSTDSRALGVVAHWCVNSTTGILLPVAEEVIPAITLPSGASVVFDRGLWYQTPHLVVIGSSPETDEVYLARKPWGRIGANRDPDLSSSRPNDPRWTYYTGTGWSLDSGEMVPILDSAGSPVTTIGPVSTVNFFDRSYWATVEAVEGTGRQAVILTSRRNDLWKRLGTIDLGSTIDNSYLGGTAQLQQMLSPNPIQPLTSQSAIPLVVSTMPAEFRLKNTWSVFPVSRL